MQLDGKNALITGGLGFIGSNLAHRLVQKGVNVTLYDALLKPYGWNYANIKEIENDVKVKEGDIRDIQALARVAKGQDIIYHFAAQVGREISMENPQLDTDINCKGTLNLCEVCTKLEKKPKIVYAGSRGQIGEPVYLPVDENHPTTPTDIYGINKLAAEKYLLLYGNVFDFPVVSLRLNNVYGPRCQMQHGYYGILNWFIRNAMTGEPITVYGKGTQTRDYVYIDDVVEAFIAAGEYSSCDGNVYFIGSGQETVFLDMVKEIQTSVGKGKIMHIPFPEQRESIDIKKFVINYDKFNAATGWKPKVTLQTGVQKTVAFYKQRLYEYID